METEIKLSPVEPSQASQVFSCELIRPHLGPSRRHDMESTYYQDKYGLLQKIRAALRLRRENGEGVCCLKVKKGVEGAAAVRHEYEVHAENIEAGVELLCEMSEIPEEIRAILKGAELTPVCGSFFTRTEADYITDELSFVLSYDIGEHHNGDRRAPLGEIELELKEGSVERLNEIAEYITRTFSLEYGKVSKYAAALALGETEEAAPENTPVNETL